MARSYSIVSGAQFKPFSYSDMLAPVLAAQQEHNALEQAYSDLAYQANTVAEIAQSEDDPILYQRYKDYADALENGAVTLEREGLNMNSRKNMLDLRNRYTKDIMPIQIAYDRRRQLADQIREAKMKDPTLMVQRDVANARLMDFIRNPEYDYGQVVSGNMLTAQTSQAAANLKNQMRNDPRRWRKILGDQYYETVMKKGYEPQEILDALAGNPDSPEELRNIVANVFAGSGIADWNDPFAVRMAQEYIGRGLWSAIGSTEYKELANRQWDYAQKAASSSKKSGSGFSLPTRQRNYRTIRRTNVADTNRSKIQKDKEFLQEMINNPKKIFTEQELMSTAPYYYPNHQSKPNQKRINDIIDRYLERLDNTGIKYSDKDASGLNRLIEELDKDEKASVFTDYIYQLNMTDNKYLSKVLGENAVARASSGSSTGLFSLDKDGNRDKEANADEARNVIDGDFNLSLDLQAPKGEELRISGKVKDGNEYVTKTYVVDPDLFGNNATNISSWISDIREGLLDDDEESRALAVAGLQGYNDENGVYRGGIMDYLYNYFNTLARVQQSTTDVEKYLEAIEKYSRIYDSIKEAENPQ